MKLSSRWIPTRSATRSSKPDLNVISKLGEHGLDGCFESEALSRRNPPGIDFKKQDSIYCKINKNNNTVYRSYSDDMFELLKKMQGDENYNPSWIDSEFLKNAKK